MPSGAAHDSRPVGFRQLSESLIHRGHIWRVMVGTFRSPSGEEFQRDIVRSPGAVGVVPVRDIGGAPTVVLVCQYRPPLDRMVLEIPAGVRDVPEELTEATAARELAEEVGLRAGQMDYLINYYTSAGMTDSVLHLYLATDLSSVTATAHGPEEEHMEIVELPLAEAIEMVVRGEIRDAKTVIGLLLVDRRLRG
ncbi:MAG: NUDIX hydrolase [Actinobacteria bacterium]|nr:NUDIX hydrolase [Actinomycetota bacterium]